MFYSRPLHLVIPQDQEWPVIGHEQDGTLILQDGFIDDVESLNGLEAGSLSETQIHELLVAWYQERCRIGLPHDPAMEQIVRTHSAA